MHNLSSFFVLSFFTLRQNNGFACLSNAGVGHVSALGQFPEIFGKRSLEFFGALSREISVDVAAPSGSPISSGISAQRMNYTTKNHTDLVDSDEAESNVASTLRLALHF